MVILLWLAIAVAPALFARAKTDVLVMRNGDRITCEIRSLERGQLKISTSYTTGTIPVDWSQVERIESKHYFRVEMKDGRRYTGTIKKEPTSKETKNSFVIIEGGEEERAAKADVVELGQLEKSWLSNIDGRISGGFDFTKSNSRASYVLNAGLDYKTPRRAFQTRLLSTITAQDRNTTTETHNLDFSFYSGWKNNWFTGALAGFTRSDELNLNLRTTVGGGVGRFLVHSHRTQFRVLGGMVFTRELFREDRGGVPSQNSAEGLVDVNFGIFRFDSTELTAYIRVFPSFSRAGRVRSIFGVDFKLDLIGDLYWNMSLWDSYDSAPPLNTSGSDRTVSTTIGWSF